MLPKYCSNKDPIPNMLGKNNIPAMQEIHIFLAPINPNQYDVEKFQNLVRKFNDKYEPLFGSRWKPMKACHLALQFKSGWVNVIQSSRYVLSNNPDDVIWQSYNLDSKIFENEFQIIRVKIEASLHGIEGLPSKNEEMIKFKRYYEHHIKVCVKDCEPGKLMTNEELQSLENLSKQLEKKYKLPIPLSYNKISFDDLGGFQRYLNVRFRNLLPTQVLQIVKEITTYINTNTIFQVIKSIDEYVWYDTYPQLDAGWIDPTKWTLIMLRGKRYSGKSTICNIIKKFCETKGIPIHLDSFPNDFKKDYMKNIHATDIDINIDDKTTKEKNRLHFTNFFNNIVKLKGDDHYVKKIIERINNVISLNPIDKGFYVIDGIRRRQDYYYFKEAMNVQLSKILLVDITSNEIGDG